MLFLVLHCGVKCREKVCPLLTCCWNVFYVMALTKWTHKHRGSVGCICVTVFVSVLVFVSVFVFMQSGLSHVEEVGGLCRRGGEHLWGGGGEHLSLRLRSPLLFPPLLQTLQISETLFQIQIHKSTYGSPLLPPAPRCTSAADPAVALQISETLFHMSMWGVWKSLKLADVIQCTLKTANPSTSCGFTKTVNMDSILLLCASNPPSSM